MDGEAWWAAVHGVVKSRTRLKQLSSSSGSRHNSGEGNGTPLQYSCLENPMDGEAWWAAVHGVAKSLDMTERFHFHFSLSCIGEGNGNPLQCSCLKNPREGGAWWAAIYGVLVRNTAGNETDGSIIVLCLIDGKAASILCHLL